MPRHTTRINSKFVQMVIILRCVTMCGTAPPAGGPADSDTGPDGGGESDTHTTSETESSCDGEFFVSASLSETISTVGIVKWSSSVKGISDASIEFGRDGAVEYTAPVHLNEKGNRTLLLGMKPATRYDYRIVITHSEGTCKSATYHIETGPQPTSVPFPEVSTPLPDAVSGEFVITSLLMIPMVIIMDKDGELVWWYTFDTSGEHFEDMFGISRAHMSTDGEFMWAGNLNVGRNNGRLYRVTMDGLTEFPPEETEHHHDFAVLPDNNLACLVYDLDGLGTCDKIVERAPNGDIETVYAIREAIPHHASDSEWCHANAVHYAPFQDAYYVSLLRQSMILKINRSGRFLEWILDGDSPEESDFSGVSWVNQHGHHTLEDGTILLFNNGPRGLLRLSVAIELSLDESAGRATQNWRYDSGHSSPMLGDVQRLSNGNTLVTYSNAGTLHEIDNSRNLVRETTFDMGNVIGYSDARRSFYGAPDRY